MARHDCQSIDYTRSAFREEEEEAEANNRLGYGNSCNHWRGAGFLGGYLPQKNQGTTTATPSLGVSITSPTYQISPVGEVFSGQVEGLGPGQTIWLFSKQLTNPSGPTSAGVLVVNQGPCDITGTAWTCPDVGIGGNHPKDNGSYQVWVAVVDPSQARELQDDIAHHSSVIQGDEPPHADGGIDSENVTRSS